MTNEEFIESIRLEGEEFKDIPNMEGFYMASNFGRIVSLGRFVNVKNGSVKWNNPRILKFFPHVLSMYTGEVLELHSDEDMLAEFKKHEKAFNKARKLSNGRPKVYD